MEYKRFDFDPQGGFLDSNFYEDTPANPREVLQRQHDQTRDYINNIVDTLNSDIEGESGIESIRSPEIEGVKGNNAYSQIKDIKKQLNEVSLSQVPDGSIGTDKLATGSVTNEKIKDGQISTNKFSSEACAPFSSDTKNINGISSEKYMPISQTGDIHFFKEYVCKCDLSSLHGKIYDNKRYILSKNYLYFIDLITGSCDKVSDIFLTTDSKYFFDKTGQIYVVQFSCVSSVTTISIFHYNTEYNELILIKEFTINKYYASLVDVIYDGQNMYFGLSSNSSTSLFNFNLYRVKTEDLTNWETLEELYYFQSSNEALLFFAGEDVVYVDKMFKNGNADEVITLQDAPYEYDSGRFLYYNRNVIMRDKNTLEPVLIVDDVPSKYYYFVHKDYFYRLLGGYVVKTRLF